MRTVVYTGQGSVHPGSTPGPVPHPGYTLLLPVHHRVLHRTLLSGYVTHVQGSSVDVPGPPRLPFDAPGLPRLPVDAPGPPWATLPASGPPWATLPASGPPWLPCPSLDYPGFPARAWTTWARLPALGPPGLGYPLLDYPGLATRAWTTFNRELLLRSGPPLIGSSRPVLDPLLPLIVLSPG